MGGKKQKPAEPKSEKTYIAKVQESWEAAKSFFDRKRIVSTFEGILPLAEPRLSLGLLLLSSVIVTLISFGATLESMQLANFTSDTLGTVSGSALPKVGPE